MSTDNLDSSDTESVVVRALQAIARRNRMHGRMRSVVGLIAIAYGLAMGSYRILKGHWPEPAFTIWLVAYGLTGMCYLTGQVFLERRAIRALAETDDIRGVGPLLDIAFGTDHRFYDHATRMAAVSALIRLLPRITRKNDLTSQHVTTMREILKSDGYNSFGTYHPPGLVLATLNCLIGIGDTEILESVGRLSREAHEPGVRAAALAALPSMREMIPERRATNTLLRPASVVEDCILLKPAGCAPSDDQTLLRPAESP